MSIADKLTSLINTKQDIKSAISEKGVEVTGGMTTYADAIRRIETGSGGKFQLLDGMKLAWSDFEYVPSSYSFELVNDFSDMFTYNFKLKELPDIDITRSKSIQGMCELCKMLERVGNLDTSNCRNVGDCFRYCVSLKSLPLLDFTKVTSASLFLNNHTSDGSVMAITDLGGFKNLKIDFTGSLNYCPNLTTESLMNVINNLYDFPSNNSSETRKLQLGEVNLNKLTEEQKSIAVKKGWILS